MPVHAYVEHGLGRVVVDHPPLNILTRELLGCVREEVGRLARDRSLRALLVTAEGKHFSAGADVAEHLPPNDRSLIPEFLATLTALERFPVPTLAAVQGRCLGGGFELALAVDLIVAAENAVFGQPEIVLGVLPPAACALLWERCPAGVAAEILFTGDPLDAVEAHRSGLVRRVVPPEALERAALALAGRITRHSAAALRVGRAMWREGRTPDWSAAMDRAGRRYLDDLMATEDAVEGLRAFLEKRSPVWRHQ